jgi:hypothetical protein
MLLHVQVCCLFQTLAAISVHDFHGIATSCSLLGRGIDRGKGAPAKAQKYTGFVPKIPRIFPCFRGSLFNKSLDFRGPLFFNKSTHTKGTWTCWLSQTRPTMTNRFHLDMWMFQQWPYLPSNTPMSNSVSLLRASGGSGNDIAELCRQWSSKALHRNRKSTRSACGTYPMRAYNLLKTQLGR